MTFKHALANALLVEPVGIVGFASLSVRKGLSQNRKMATRTLRWWWIQTSALDADYALGHALAGSGIL
jgi:hypothetical protein